MSFPPATEMFQFAGFASSAYEFSGRSPKGWGFPIRKSRSQRVLASRPSLSQRATSFIASQCQGIHQMPLKRFIITEPENTVARRDKTPPRDPFRFPYLLPPVQPPAKTSQRSNGHEDTYLLENIPAPAATRTRSPPPSRRRTPACSQDPWFTPYPQCQTTPPKDHQPPPQGKPPILKISLNHPRSSQAHPEPSNPPATPEPGNPELVEVNGIEPMTSCLQSRRSTN